MALTRQIIVDKIKARMELILTSGGFYTNLGQKVVTWKTVPVQKNQQWSLDIRDGGPDDEEEQDVEAEDESLTRHKLPVTIRILANSAQTSDVEIRKAIADVEKAIKIDETWDRLADRTDPVSNRIDVAQEGEKIAGATVKVIVEYLTEKFSEE